MSDLPDQDRVRSPHTGWTRAHWEAVADGLLAGVRPFASPGHALIDLPGAASWSGRWSDGLEGFARTFLLAGFRLSAGHPDDGRPGDEKPCAAEELERLAHWYACGLDAGTDPRSPERWPTPAERDQAKVECASIALALHETRPWIWDRLEPRVREQIVDWMTPILGSTVPDNNWIWFQNITQAFLRSVGASWRPDEIRRNLDRTEDWYVGHGWYSDGVNSGGEPRNFDYYNGWALHLYPLWYCRISGADAEPGLLDRYRARLRRYLEDAQHLVGADGGPLFQGRSLTYRFASAAPFWVGELFDATPLAPGLTRRLTSGTLQHFTERGAPDGASVLRPGWYHEFPTIRQPYSGPASPYWAAKAFAGLALPADHPAWTAVEQPLAIELGDVETALAGPGWLLSGTAADGIVRIANHGGDHADPGRPGADDPFYARLGYSTRTGPELGDLDAATPLDGHVALVTADGRASLRRPVERLGVAGRVGISRHRAHWLSNQVHAGSRPPIPDGPLLTVASALHGAVELRAVLVGRPEPGADRGPWRLRLGGWSLAGQEPPEERVGSGEARVARPDGLVSSVIPIRGLATLGVARHRDANAFGPHSACPWAMTAGPVVPGEVYLAAVLLTADPEAERGARELRVRVVPGTDAAVVEVDWPDGEHDSVRLATPDG
ncbi:DUF2264 domain-containing protein [Streptacidiphilus albus]|uniref:DUF2264 domain-containing protein n=1 Tax=Streptacidiphilus albus TaxID=105425 RepID=UPI00054BA0F9|nr:DUF2264 domain-containing protein [Streptacidiphilus albus]